MAVSKVYRRKITNFIMNIIDISDEYLDWNNDIYLHVISDVLEFMVFDLRIFNCFDELKKAALKQEGIIIGEIWKSHKIKEKESCDEYNNRD